MMPKVDFISAPRPQPDGVYRPGGPIARLIGEAYPRFVQQVFPDAA
jgi:hypothetical protein